MLVFATPQVLIIERGQLLAGFDFLSFHILDLPHHHYHQQNAATMHWLHSTDL
jgi:hypothetical protein